jgi:hypothetical protein
VREWRQRQTEGEERERQIEERAERDDRGRNVTQDSSFFKALTKT